MSPAGAVTLAAFIAVAAAIVWYGTRDDPEPRTWPAPSPDSHPYPAIWGPAQRPRGPRPDTAPLARLRLEDRAAQYRIEDLMRDPCAPRPWTPAGHETGVHPALHGEVA